MSDTDRKQLFPNQQTSPIFQEEFIDSYVFGCFSHKIYLVINQRTLYLYPSQSDY